MLKSTRPNELRRCATVGREGKGPVGEIGTLDGTSAGDDIALGLRRRETDREGDAIPAGEMETLDRTSTGDRTRFVAVLLADDRSSTGDRTGVVPVLFADDRSSTGDRTRVVAVLFADDRSAAKALEDTIGARREPIFVTAGPLC